MRRIALLFTLSGLAACSGGADTKQAAAQEQAELAACQATYPVRPGLFASRATCDFGAVGSYVQLTDPGENPRTARMSRQLEADAAAVDAGTLTPDAWRDKLSAAIDALPHGARRLREGAKALL